MRLLKAPSYFVYSNMKNLLLICFLGMSLAMVGQKKAEVSFAVNGVCGMCEARIEKAYDLPGILNADWDLETKKLRVAYKVKEYTVEELHEVAARAGHDTDIAKATDEEYMGLHGCCKYREGAVCGSSPDHHEH